MIVANVSKSSQYIVLPREARICIISRNCKEIMLSLLKMETVQIMIVSAIFGEKEL